MMRQIRKQFLTITRLTAFCVLLAGTAAAPVARAQTSSLVETYITDPLSGVAIYGFDPVSYYTGNEPLHGRPEFEYVWRGISWLFANAANRDVFAADPEVYAPQFGGYGLMSLARGYLSEGNPRIYVILGGRLFFFYSTSNRDAFMLAQRTAYERAAENWQVLSKNLAGAHAGE